MLTKDLVAQPAHTGDHHTARVQVQDPRRLEVSDFLLVLELNTQYHAPDHGEVHEDKVGLKENNEGVI